MSLKVTILALVALSLVSSACCEYDRAKFKELVTHDTSNDDALYLSAQQLIERSGFRYENHYVAASDGYITNLVRLINPLAQREHMHKTPVLMFHGANIDSSSYLVASSIQHHPEPWPRTDKPVTSSQRSLAFALANEGYDVWLMGSRGSNDENKRFTTDPEIQAKINSGDYSPLHTLASKELEEFSKTKQYWQYGLDDIVAYDLDLQINRVKELTGKEEISIYSFSLSTPTLLAFLAERPEIARQVKNFFQMGPAIASEHFTFFDRFYFEKLCPHLPTRGIGFAPAFFLGDKVRNLIVKLSKNQDLKYTVILSLLRVLFGPSRKYQANLERNLLAHVLLPVSFKSVQQYCQQSVTQEVSFFDYKKKKNLQVYGQKKPPAYDVSNLEVQNWVLISGTHDALADPTTVEKLKTMVHTPKPVVHIAIPYYNHLDMIAGVEIDKYISRPVIEILNENSDN